jgi:molecular chaperone DnaK
VFTKIIERNTTIPTSKSQMFSTATDGQRTVEIHVLQGERAMAQDNKSLGKFLLQGIPPAPRGVPQIEVIFEIDANGILKVSAQDKGTGRAQSIQITNTGGLSESEVEQMRRSAELFAEDDRKRRQVAELKNQADSLFYNYEATLKENAELVSDDLKAELSQQAEELRAALQADSLTVEEMRHYIDAFQTTLFSIGTAVYQGANSSTGDELAEAVDGG